MYPTFKKLNSEEIMNLLKKDATLERINGVYPYYVIRYNGINYYHLRKNSVNSILNNKKLIFDLTEHSKDGYKLKIKI